MRAKQKQLLHAGVKTRELQPEIARDLYFFFKSLLSVSEKLHAFYISWVGNQSYFQTSR